MRNQPKLTLERSALLAERAEIIPLTLGRARIVVTHTSGMEYEKEFW